MEGIAYFIIVNMWLRGKTQLLTSLILFLIVRSTTYTIQRNKTPPSQQLAFVSILRDHFYNSKSDNVSTPFRRITRLFHKHGRSRKHLSIRNQTVDTNANDRAHLVIESDSFGTVKIHSFKRPVHYLCIGPDARPRGVPEIQLDAASFDINDCIFREYTLGKHVQFKSEKYYNKKNNTGCLAFNKFGRGRNVRISKCGKRNTLFMERKPRIIIDIYKNGKFKNQLFKFLRNQQG